MTASRASVVMYGSARARRTYLEQLRKERSGGELAFEGQSGRGPMLWGQEYEEKGLQLFSFLTDLNVVRPDPPCIPHPQMPDDVGASPDGLIVRDGRCVATIEMKCPWDEERHQSHVLVGMPDEYKPQVQFQMWVCEVEEAYFCSYNPRLKTSPIHVELVPRDQEFINRLDERVRAFVELLRNGGDPQEYDPLANPLPQLF